MSSINGWDLGEMNEDDVHRTMQAFSQAEEELAEYKELEKQGRLIKLPCKMGDPVYMLNSNKSLIQKMVVDTPDIRCHCVKDDEFACCAPICNDTRNNICAYRFKRDFSEIGKTVFLTREEAEAALKKGADE